MFPGGDVTPANQVKEIYGAETLVLIATPVDYTYRVLAKQMRDLSMHFCGVDEYVFSQHVPELMECFDSFADETSRELYWDALNEEIKDMFQDVRLSVANMMDIEFVTDSILMEIKMNNNIEYKYMKYGGGTAILPCMWS